MTTSPLRKAINRHLWQRHDRFAANGSTENRMIQHEMIHAKGNCDHTHPVPQDPSVFEDTVEG